jgi:hypothetical protein
MEPTASYSEVTEAPTSLVTIFVSSIPGHNATFTLPKDASISEIYQELADRDPWILKTRISLTTNSRQHVSSQSAGPISSLLSSDADTFLPLRLTLPLCGGKGGFGSQLRAQGGRMASRKKRDQDNANSSSRNLEGRRIRTVNEAKMLTEYLAMKPEMDRREREERVKRWQNIVDAAEQKQEDIRTGRHVRLDGKWVEDKEEAENKTREAVLKALQARIEEEAEDVAEGEATGTVATAPAASSSSKAAPTPAPAQRTLFGWDDEDEEFMSDSDEEEEVSEEDVKVDHEGKGKGKAVA